MCACVYAHTLYREDVEARDQFTAVSPLCDGPGSLA